MGSFSRYWLAAPAKLHEEDKRKHIAWSFGLTLLAFAFVVCRLVL